MHLPIFRICGKCSTIGGRLLQMFQFAQRPASTMKALHEELVDATRVRNQRSLTRALLRDLRNNQPHHPA